MPDPDTMAQAAGYGGLGAGLGVAVNKVLHSIRMGKLFDKIDELDDEIKAVETRLDSEISALNVMIVRDYYSKVEIAAMHKDLNEQLGKINKTLTEILVALAKANQDEKGVK